MRNMLVEESVLDKPTLRRAFGTFVTGVVAVAAEVDGKRYGFAASTFTGVSLDPPLVSISVAETSGTWPRLRDAERIGVTVLTDRQAAVCKQLAGPARSRFRDVPVDVSDRGAVTIRHGLAMFECSLYQEVRAGDHLVVLLRLHAVRQTEDGEPLTFHRSRFGGLVPSDT